MTARALDIYKALLPFWNSINNDNLPACVKCALERQSPPAECPRAPMPAATEAQRISIDPLLKAVLAYSESGSPLSEAA
jgi:4-hydroxy-tetrahydrodipicolinate synthase